MIKLKCFFLCKPSFTNQVCFTILLVAQNKNNWFLGQLHDFEPNAILRRSVYLWITLFEDKILREYRLDVFHMFFLHRIPLLNFFHRLLFLDLWPSGYLMWAKPLNNWGRIIWAMVCIRNLWSERFHCFSWLCFKATIEVCWIKKSAGSFSSNSVDCRLLGLPRFFLYLFIGCFYTGWRTDTVAKTCNLCVFIFLDVSLHVLLSNIPEHSRELCLRGI